MKPTPEMAKPLFENLHSQFHVYQSKKIERIFFINSLSLGFVESIASDCEFVESENLIFHRSKIESCSFGGTCQNIIFDDCELENCAFDEAKLLKVSFTGKTTIKKTTGLPPTKRWLEGLPFSKRI